jgi:hypothetical protein
MFCFGYIDTVLQLCDVSLVEQLIIGGACYKESAGRGAFRLRRRWRRGDSQAMAPSIRVPTLAANPATRYFFLPTRTWEIHRLRTYSP